ncbi:MAG: V-type ATP synthase subunit D [Gaiellales bacterium]
MPLRPPPGRAAHPWLMRRIAMAERGAEILTDKHLALLRRRQELQEATQNANRRWCEAAGEAEVWLARALVVSGARAVRLAAPMGAARVDLEWANSLGVIHPSSVSVAPPDDGGALNHAGSTVDRAAQAHRCAVAAAAEHAALTLAHRLLTDEISLTARRLRAVQRRWIPRYQAALAELDLSLDEQEREDQARTRWGRAGHEVGS